MAFQQPPVLSERNLKKFQRGKPLKFPLNEEATSVSIAPSGRFVCAGFTDGTVRLFDLTGHFRNDTSTKKKKVAHTEPGSPLPRTSVVDSKRHQKYGAVACQIHAKGVHTSLRMHVDLSEDGLWCFAGVLRGSMELLAIYLGDLQNAYQEQEEKAQRRANAKNLNDACSSQDEPTDKPDLLDHITVYRHSDAKLRGFGACTRLRNSDRYLLLSGKSIKNIHIWSFDPPQSPDEDPVLVQLYDTSTNGITINFLQFRRHALTGALQAISKSDGQRLRIWDMTDEEEGKYNSRPQARPNRPPFQDVPNTEGTLAVANGLCICGGSQIYNQISLVSLDVENLQSHYNHTELALPGVSASPMTGLSRRTQRGDLKSVVAAYGSIQDNADGESCGNSSVQAHVLLEISDGTLGHYRAGQPQLTLNENLPWHPNTARTMAVGRIPGACPIAAVALYQAGSLGKGQLSVWPLEKPKAPVASHFTSEKAVASVTVESPSKTEEKSIASTAATTPESLPSRRDLENPSSVEKERPSPMEKLASPLDSPAKTENRPNTPGCELSNPTVASHQETDENQPKRPVLKLVLRLSSETQTANTINTTDAKGENTPVTQAHCFAANVGVAKLKRDRTTFTKTEILETKKSLAPYSSSKQMARRLSHDSLNTSRKARRRLSNGRPHSAPTFSTQEQLVSQVVATRKEVGGLVTVKPKSIVDPNSNLHREPNDVPKRLPTKTSGSRDTDQSAEARKASDLRNACAVKCACSGSLSSSNKESASPAIPRKTKLEKKMKMDDGISIQEIPRTNSERFRDIKLAQPPSAKFQAVKWNSGDASQIPAGRPAQGSASRMSPTITPTAKRVSADFITGPSSQDTASHDSPREFCASATPSIQLEKSFGSSGQPANTSSRSCSPQPEPFIVGKFMSTAPKQAEQQSFITPTPKAKVEIAQIETWEQLSLGSVAQTLSSLKRSPTSSPRIIETPLVSRRVEENVLPSSKNSIQGKSCRMPPPSFVEKNPLPVPRVLHPDKSSPNTSEESTMRFYAQISSTKHPKGASFDSQPMKSAMGNTEKFGLVTPLVGKKRKARRNSPRATESSPPNADRILLSHNVEDSPPAKRYRIDSLDWLRPDGVLRGRRDDQSMRRAITKECKRQRVAIEEKVKTLCLTRSCGSMGQVEKMVLEHQAASLFLEKRIWRSVRSLLQSIERAPSIAALQESKHLLQEILEDYKITATTMLKRHEMEMSSMMGANPVSPCQKQQCFSSSFDISLFDKIIDCFPRMG